MTTARQFLFVLAFVVLLAIFAYSMPITEQQLVMRVTAPENAMDCQGDVYLDGSWEDLPATQQRNNDEFLYELFQDHEQEDDDWLLPEMQDQWIEEWERYNDEDVNSALMLFSTPDDDNIVELTVMTKAKQSLVAYFEEEDDLDYASET